jgi:3-deoxy-manno-octulosonate cytidylyltransferase (CMP-KDO synthetase)
MKTLAFKVIIPARLRSTRLPGKMLADIAGKPMVAWVAERAAESGAEEVVIATDHADIADAMVGLGWRVCTTSTSHATGTDRLAEAVDLLRLEDDEIVVNVQGDEPLIDPLLVRAVARELALRPKASIATAVHPIATARAFFDPNVVKVVHDTDGYATYFSRAPIPYAPHRHLRLPGGVPAQVHDPLAHAGGAFRGARAAAGAGPRAPDRGGVLERAGRGGRGYPRGPGPRAEGPRPRFRLIPPGGRAGRV